MPRTFTNRSRKRIEVEPLEGRQLLSSTTAPGLIHADATTPMTVTLHYGKAMAPAGDYVDVVSPRVGLEGQTTPGSTVRLFHATSSGRERAFAKTTADASGSYRFNIVCTMGTTPFTVQATDASGDQASASMDVTRANQAIAWNSIALQAIRNDKSQAPNSARELAIVSLSVYDAVNAIENQYAPYAITVKAPAGASPDAAAASAAATALSGLFPQQASTFQAELATTLSAIPNGPARDKGIALGATVADQILALRANDGSNTNVHYVPGTAPGDWVPTPPAHAAAVDPQWGQVTPFALMSASQFQPPPPPAITSAQYAAETNLTEALGGTTSTVRTADQTAAAKFWSDLAGTFDPPGHWNQIAEIAAINAHSNLETSARTFAMVDIALADAGIEAWNVKYTDNTWRPVTVIRNGDLGLNPGITANPTWTPLWSTPAFPSYISGHSTFSAAAANVLDSIYGNHFSFTDPGDPTENLAPRTFSSFDQAAQEAGMSRIWGGIHYMSDNIYGLLVGGEVGNYVVQNALLPLPK